MRRTTRHRLRTSIALVAVLALLALVATPPPGPDRTTTVRLQTTTTVAPTSVPTTMAATTTTRHQPPRRASRSSSSVPTRRSTTTSAAPAPAGRAQTGVASYYATRAGTCAHKTLPFGTIVTVTGAGRTTTCRVSDRGPYVAGRIIDLDTRVFAQLAPTSSGVLPVTITW